MCEVAGSEFGIAGRYLGHRVMIAAATRRLKRG